VKSLSASEKKLKDMYASSGVRVEHLPPNVRGRPKARRLVAWVEKIDGRLRQRILPRLSSSPLEGTRCAVFGGGRLFCWVMVAERVEANRQKCQRRAST